MTTAPDFPGAPAMGLVYALQGQKGGKGPPVLGNLLAVLNYAVCQATPAELEDEGGDCGRALVKALEHGDKVCVNWVEVIQAAAGLLQILFPGGIPIGKGKEVQEEKEEATKEAAAQVKPSRPPREEGRGHI